MRELLTMPVCQSPRLYVALLPNLVAAESPFKRPLLDQPAPGSTLFDPRTGPPVQGTGGVGFGFVIGYTSNMSHPLEDVIRKADGFVLIGDSSQARFPAYSYHAYTTIGKRFFCLDLGGLKESRGATSGGPVCNSVEELPEDRGELAIIWVHPNTAKRAVEIAHSAGCSKVWFSFKTGHRDAVARARELGLEVVEIGRCPVYYLDDKPGGCKVHSAITKLTGAYAKPPQLDGEARHREMW